jgi:hypothetical protein
VALKSAQDATVSLENVEETLDTIDKTLERVKTLYEQYFLGIQKQPPAFMHNEIERKLRELTQLQIRNTGLRYRFATLQQKFGAYNSYWKRTLRQIENGTYIRNLSKIGREAVRSGAEIPEEILAAMPKRMREQVLRDREQALAIAQRRKLDHGNVADEELLTLAPPEVPPPPDELAAVISEPTALRRELKTRSGAYVVDEKDADLDLDKFFAQAFDEEEATKQKPVEPPKPAAPAPKPLAPSQVTRPNPIAPGAAAARGPVAVDEAAAPGTTGKLPSRIPTVSVPKVIPPIPKPAAKPAVAAAPPPPRPPAGMSDADVNALYAKYVQAKQAVGEQVGPDGRQKLLKTITAQAPKIMEQYKAKGVDFSVVVKDNQVIIRAKPKT